MRLVWPIGAPAPLMSRAPAPPKDRQRTHATRDIFFAYVLWAKKPGGLSDERKKYREETIPAKARFCASHDQVSL